MIADPTAVVLTAHVAHWADQHPIRLAWIIDCLTRHNTADWGDLDPTDTAHNNAALTLRNGRLLSRYPVPTTMLDPALDDDTLWIITDNLADPDTTTTILWPTDY